MASKPAICAGFSPYFFCNICRKKYEYANVVLIIHGKGQWKREDIKIEKEE